MTFIEALQWMSESKDNICRHNSSSYKMECGRLMMQFGPEEWAESALPISIYTENKWEKIKSKKKITFYEVIVESDLCWSSDIIYMKGRPDIYILTGNTKEVEIENG